MYLNKKILVLSISMCCFGLNYTAKANTINHNQIIHDSLKQVNYERTKRGIKPLKLNNDLNKIANQRAKQIVTNFTHYNKNSKGIAATMMKNNYKINNLGENIASSQNHNYTYIGNALNSIHGMMYDDASDNWGHRKNFLNKNSNVVGIGVYITNNKTVYTAYDFGTK